MAAINRKLGQLFCIAKDHENMMYEIHSTGKEIRRTQKDICEKLDIPFKGTGGEAETTPEHEWRSEHTSTWVERLTFETTPPASSDDEEEEEEDEDSSDE